VTPLPAIVSLTRAGTAVALELELAADLPVFSGHFPGTPILPAVAQVDWALRLAREHFELPSHFSGLRSLKFLRVMQPPARVSLELVHDGSAVSFAYTQSGAACSTGRIEFTDDAAGPDRSLL
jgi:3-hydroxymyristoyl/3-hydroxydecanoyl-(acyl carrier protein) dehydratase